MIKGQVIVTCEENAKLSLAYIPGRSFLVATDENGKFRFDNLPPRAAGYKVRIQPREGAETDVQSPPVASGQVVTLADVFLCHCGNDIREDDNDEDCDGADLDEQTCLTIGGFTGGDLACLPNCDFDTSGCMPE